MKVDSSIIQENIQKYKDDLFFMLCTDVKNTDGIEKGLYERIERCEALMYHYLQIENKSSKKLLTKSNNIRSVINQQ